MNHSPEGKAGKAIQSQERMCLNEKSIKRVLIRCRWVIGAFVQCSEGESGRRNRAQILKHLLCYIEELETDPVNERGHLKDIKQENDKIWFNC